MSGAVFRDYDRAALDREYDNRNKVPGFDFNAFVAALDADSKAARRKHDCVLDVAYGRKETQRLDIFRPIARGAPVHIFFHGGYWRLFGKQDFSYIANGVIPHDTMLVVVNYSLVPTVTMDQLVAECFSSIAWVMQNIEQYGGDPDRISISGHSAGGHLAAMMMTRAWPVSPGRQSPFESICCISGIFELEPIRQCFLNDTLMLSEVDVVAHSPRFRQRKVSSRLCVVVGEREGDEYLRQSREFSSAWAGEAGPVELIEMAGKDHFSIRQTLGDPSSEVLALALGHQRT